MCALAVGSCGEWRSSIRGRVNSFHVEPIISHVPRHAHITASSSGQAYLSGEPRWRLWSTLTVQYAWKYFHLLDCGRRHSQVYRAPRYLSVNTSIPHLHPWLEVGSGRVQPWAGHGCVAMATIALRPARLYLDAPARGICLSKSVPPSNSHCLGVQREQPGYIHGSTASLHIHVRSLYRSAGRPPQDPCRLRLLAGC